MARQQTPDEGATGSTQVAARGTRRRFTVDSKASIVQQGATCRAPVEIGVLLRRESATLAQRLNRTVCERHSIDAVQPTTHSDRGRIQTAKDLHERSEDLGVVRSLSRPRVRSANLFAESQFEAAKYSPPYPERSGRRSRAAAGHDGPGVSAASRALRPRPTSHPRPARCGTNTAVWATVGDTAARRQRHRPTVTTGRCERSALELDEEAVHRCGTDVLGGVRVCGLVAEGAARNLQPSRCDGVVGTTKQERSALDHHHNHVGMAV